MVHLTRKEHFNAAHRLYVDAWSKKKNQEVFGKCANEHYHGHNFEVFVTVKGEPDPVTGFIMNAHELSQIMKREICDELDHKNLNLEVDWLQDVNPTCEVVVMKIWERIEPLIPSARLHCIRLQETPRIYVEYFGPKH